MALIAPLADTAMIRAGTTCHAEVAKSAAKYTLSYKGDHWCVQAIAHDRAVAAAYAL